MVGRKTDRSDFALQWTGENVAPRETLDLRPFWTVPDDDGRPSVQLGY